MNRGEIIKENIFEKIDLRKKDKIMFDLVFYFYKVSKGKISILQVSSHSKRISAFYRVRKYSRVVASVLTRFA